MSGPDPALAEEEAPDDEYDELVQLIVYTEWQPGDTFRTAKGSTWQFRVTPYTSDFPDVSTPHAATPG
jgi:hypothetical protein